MPNHTDCVLRVTGPEDERARFVRDVEGDGPRWFISPRWRKFEKLPEGEDRHAAKSSVLQLHALVPVPQEVQDRGFGDAGYAWCLKRWGTKWGAYEVERVSVAHGVAYFFQSAWRPPVEWLRTVAEMFPTLTFELWARDEYPYAMTVLAYDSGHEEMGRVFEVCYGESSKAGAQ